MPRKFLEWSAWNSNEKSRVSRNSNIRFLQCNTCNKFYFQFITPMTNFLLVTSSLLATRFIEVMPHFLQFIRASCLHFAVRCILM